MLWAHFVRPSSKAGASAPSEGVDLIAFNASEQVQLSELRKNLNFVGGQCFSILKLTSPAGNFVLFIS